MDRLKVEPAIESAQRKRLAEIYKRRNAGRTNELPYRLEEMAQNDDNWIPHLIECVETDITLGEICGRLRKI